MPIRQPHGVKRRRYLECLQTLESAGSLSEIKAFYDSVVEPPERTIIRDWVREKLASLTTLQALDAARRELGDWAEDLVVQSERAFLARFRSEKTLDALAEKASAAQQGSIADRRAAVVRRSAEIAEEKAELAARRRSGERRRLRHALSATRWRRMGRSLIANARPEGWSRWPSSPAPGAGKTFAIYTLDQTELSPSRRPSSDEAPFLRAIVAAPAAAGEPNAAACMFADWLSERSREADAELWRTDARPRTRAFRQLLFGDSAGVYALVPSPDAATASSGEVADLFRKELLAVTGIPFGCEAVTTTGGGTAFVLRAADGVYLRSRAKAGADKGAI